MKTLAIVLLFSIAAWADPPTPGPIQITLSGGGSGGTGNAANEVAVAFSATPTFTCGSATAGSATHFTVGTLTGNITSSMLATCTAGQPIAFHFVQDGTGGRTVAMPTNWDSLTIDGTLSVATDVEYWYDGTNGRLTSVNGKATPFLLGQAPERAAPTTATSCGTGAACLWADSTDHNWHGKDNNSGTVSTLAVPITCTNQVMTVLASTGVITCASVAIGSMVSGLGSNVATFLATPSGANFNSMIAAGGIPVNCSGTCAKSAAYTTVLGDGGGIIIHAIADNNARTFTIDSNANVAYPLYTVITFVNSINTVTIAITADTMTLAGTASTGSRTLAVNGVATAVKIGATSWLISGPGLT